MSGSKFILLTSVLCWVFAGCTSTPPASFYTLSSIATKDTQQRVGSNEKPITISLGPVSFPEFLDRPQVVTRTSRNTLKIADFHRWGGSLQSDFNRVLSENLAALLNTDRIFLYRRKHPLEINYKITVDIKRFDGSLGDKVMLKADWIVTNQQDKKNALVKKSIIRENTNTDDYEGLVSAQSQAVLVLAREIADAIESLDANGNRP